MEEVQVFVAWVDCGAHGCRSNMVIGLTEQALQLVPCHVLEVADDFSVIHIDHEVILEQPRYDGVDNGTAQIFLSRKDSSCNLRNRVTKYRFF